MERSAIWAMFYASIIGMGRHPGTTRDGAPRLSMEEGAKDADKAMAEFDKRFPE